MEARATLRGPKVSRTLVAGVLVVVALGVGAMGGYVAANLGGGKAASPSHTASTKAIPDQSKAVLPGWLVQEITPKAAPAARILQDDIIRSARPADIPDWLVQEITPKAAPAARILQDDIIRSARPADIPDWIVQEFPAMPAPASRIQQDDILGTATAANAQAVATCPAGSHIVVWYAAKATSCVTDVVSQSAKFIE